MSDKHEGVTDWEAAARIAMARCERQEEAKVIILDFIEEMRDTLTGILTACGRGKRYDPDPVPPSDADPGL